MFMVFTKRILALLLAFLLFGSMTPVAYATNDYTAGTQVSYSNATVSESYTITVPAKLAPGGEGPVTLAGTWASNRIVTVTAAADVTLTSNINAVDQKTLKVNFAGISEAGSNTGSQTFTENVSVDAIQNALFGVWSGKFDYFVDVTTEVVFTPGLYETGAIALYEEQGPAAIVDMQIYTWDELQSNGIINSTSYGVNSNQRDLLAGDLLMPAEMGNINSAYYSSCPNLTGVLLPKDADSLAWGMFSSCTALNILILPQTVSYIPEDFIGNCSALTDVRYDGTAEQWQNTLKYNSGAMYWNWNSPADKVTCVDAQVCINGCYSYTEATCEQRAICDRCGCEYGQWAVCTPENGICTMCNRPATVIETTHYPCISYSYPVLGTWDYSDAKSVDITMVYQTDAYSSEGARITKGLDFVADTVPTETRTYLTQNGQLIETNDIRHPDISFNSIANVLAAYFHNVDMLTGTVTYLSNRSNYYGATIVVRPNYD